MNTTEKGREKDRAPKGLYRVERPKAVHGIRASRRKNPQKPPPTKREKSPPNPNPPLSPARKRKKRKKKEKTLGSNPRKRMFDLITKERKQVQQGGQLLWSFPKKNLIAMATGRDRSSPSAPIQERGGREKRSRRPQTGSIKQKTLQVSLSNQRAIKLYDTMGKEEEEAERLTCRGGNSHLNIKPPGGGIRQR